MEVVHLYRLVARIHGHHGMFKLESELLKRVEHVNNHDLIGLDCKGAFAIIRAGQVLAQRNFFGIPADIHIDHQGQRL